MNFFYLEKDILSQFYLIYSKLSTINSSDNDLKIVHNLFDSILKKLDRQIFKVFQEFAQSTLILIPKISIQLQYRLDKAEFYINYFEKNIQTENKYYIEIKMLHAELLGIYSQDSQKNADEKSKILNEALTHIQQSIDIISKPQNQIKYQFMVCNISYTIYKLIKNFFVPSFMKKFTAIVTQIHKMLININNVEYNWKGHFSWILYNCLLDLDSEKEALEVLKQLQQNSDQQNYDFHDLLFKQRVNICVKFPSLLKQIQQEVNSSKNLKWKFILKIQEFKMRLIQENQVDKEINQTIRDLNEINILENKINTDGYHEIYSELIRVCLYYGNTDTAVQLLNALKVIKAKSYRVQFLESLINAQLILQNSPTQNFKESCQGQNIQLKMHIQNRLEALKITQSVFRLNKYINDPWFIYEASVQIWNICLPFMNSEYQQFIYKPLLTAAEFLENTFCHDYKLRVQMLYQLALIDFQSKSTDKIINNSNPLQNATINIQKAIDLDNYLEESELSEKIQFLDTRIKFKKGSFDNENWKQLLKINQQIDQIIQDGQQIIQYEIQEIQQKLNKFERYNIQTEGFQLDQKLKHFQIILNETVYRIVNIAYQEQFYNILFEAIDFILESEFLQDQSNVVICIQTYYLKFQSCIQYLVDNHYDFALEQNQITSKEKNVALLTEEEINQKKETIIISCQKGIQLSQKINQNWLVFNGAILFWNHYLQYFKNSKYDNQLDKRIEPFLGELIQILKACVKQEESKNFFDYEIQQKIKIYANFCIIYTRFLENQNNFQKAQEICEDLLQCAVTDQTRKLINSIRARVLVSTQGTKQTQNKQGKDLINNNNSLQLQILMELEQLQNSSKCNTDEILIPIQNCKNLVDQWINDQGKFMNDKIKSEICTKIANFCLNQKNKKCITFALQFLFISLDIKKEEKNKNNPSMIQLLCYAQFLYGKALYELLHQYKLFKGNLDDVSLKGLKFLLKSTKNSLRCRDTKIFVDSIKKFYCFINWIKNENLNDDLLQILSKPIYTIIYYTKEAREIFQDVFGKQELQELFVNLIHVFNDCCQITQEWDLLEKACFVLLEFLDKNYQNKVWHFLVIAMTKQDKNQQYIINIIKDCSHELQAQLLLKISCFTKKPQNQYFALTKAIDILKQQQSVFIVEALMDLSEWMFRNDYDFEKLSENLLLAIDIVIEKKFINSDETQKNKNKIQQTQKLYSFEKRNKKVKIQQALVRNSKNQKSYVLDYNIQELDKLFRLHCYLSIIQDSTKERIKYLNDGMFFIQKIHDVCQLYIDNINSNEWTEQNIFLDTIFQYQQQDIFYLNRKFKKQSKNNIYFKPLLTLQFIFYAIQQYEQIEYDTPLWICVSYLQFFNNIELQCSEIELFCQLKKQILQQKLNHQNQANVDNILQKFDNIYFEEIVNKNCKNSVNKKNLYQKQKHVQLMSSIEVWVMWIRIAKCLIDLKKYDEAQKFIDNFQTIAQFQQKTEQELKSIELQSIIHFEKNDFKKANVCFQIYLKKSKYNIQSEKFLIYYLKTCKILNDEYELLEVLEKCEQTVIQQKQTKQNNLQIGYIYLFKCYLLLSNFKKFNTYFMIEKQDNYQNNIKKVFQEIIGKLFNYRNFFLQNFTFEHIKMIIEVLKNFDQTLRDLKVQNFVILKQKFLLSNSFIQLIKNISDGIQYLIIDQLLNFEDFNDDHDIQYQIIKESLTFLKTQQINEFLQLEKFHQNNSLSLPFLQQKSFASLLQANTNIDSELSLFLIDKNLQSEILNKNEEKWIKENLIDLQDDVKSKNVQKLKQQLIEIEILHSEENLALLNIDVEEDCNINENILTLLENDKKIKYQENKEQIQVESHQKLINKIHNLDFLSHDEFQNCNYFLYNIKRLELLIKKQKPHNYNNFIDFQSLMFQKKIYDYSLQINKMDKHLNLKQDQQELLQKNINYQIQKIMIFKELKKNISNLENDSIYFSLQFSQDFQMLYVCCFYVDNQQQIQCNKCQIFLANQNFTEEQELKKQQIMKQSKKYSREQNLQENEFQNKENLTNKFIKQQQIDLSETFDKNEKFDSSIHNKNIISEIQNYYKNIDIQNEKIKENKDLLQQDTFLQNIIQQCEFQNLLEVVMFFRQFIKEALDSINKAVVVIQENLNQKNQKNQQQQEQKTKFNFLWLLLDTHIIDFPIELFLQEDIKKHFNNFSRESSIQALLLKKQQSLQTILDQNKSFFLNLTNKNVENVEEINEPINQIKELTQTILQKTDDVQIDIVECQNYIQDKDIFAFFSNYDFFDIFPLKKFIKIKQNNLKLIQIFDRQKVFNQDYFKYIVRKKQEFDYIRGQQFYFVFTLFQIQFIIYPRFFYTKKQFQNIIQLIYANANQQQQFSQNLIDFEKFLDFSIVGYPVMQFGNKVIKANKKQIIFNNQFRHYIQQTNNNLYSIC